MAGAARDGRFAARRRKWPSRSACRRGKAREIARRLLLAIDQAWRRRKDHDQRRPRDDLQRATRTRTARSCSDVLEIPCIDSGGGWLIFKLPPAELGVHGGDNGFHQLYFICDDVDALIAALAAKGVDLRRDRGRALGPHHLRPAPRRRQARHLRGAPRADPERPLPYSRPRLPYMPGHAFPRPGQDLHPLRRGRARRGQLPAREVRRIWRARRRRRRQGRRHHLRGGRGPQHPDRLPLHPAFQGAARQGRRRAATGPAPAATIWSSRSRSAPRSSPTTRSMSSPTSPRSASAIVLLKGGDGGRGNASYKTSTNRAPRQHGTGWPGEEMWVWLRLKLLADAGLVGLPNAGKSTFLNAVSNAKAKVGDYPFTTLHPKLGVVRHKNVDFVLADIPGPDRGRGRRRRRRRPLPRPCRAHPRPAPPRRRQSRGRRRRLPHRPRRARRLWRRAWPTSPR